MAPRSCCREHWLKIVVIIVLLLLGAQYAVNLLVHIQTSSSEPVLIHNYLWNVVFDTGTNNSHSTTTPSPLPSPQSSPVNSTEPSPQSSNSTQNSSIVITKDCPLVPPNLVGPIKVIFESPPLPQLEQRHPELHEGGGGHWRPPYCKSRHRVAIIIPYRNRETQLSTFLLNMHPFLQKQQLDYAIFIIDQANGSQFNRAMLMNIGFVESLKLYDWQCFMFHDVDLLPEDDRNIYSCPDQPRHLSVAIDVFNYKLPYTNIFGGASALTREQFEKINGMSNEFWGWGGEDDDFSTRVRQKGKYKISRYKLEIARYKMIHHSHEVGNKANPQRFNLLRQGPKRFDKDGLNSLKYQLVSVAKLKLFTRIYVNITQPK